VQQGYKDQALRKRMEDMGAEPVGDSPAEFRAFVEAETKKWSTFVRQSGMKVEQ
jgi:tripartite-type tricarboxylate transporter receptor subunit TctC